jgi:hypothetical protein
VTDKECVLLCHGLLTSNRLIVSDGTYTTSIVKLISEPLTVVYYEEIKSL